MPSPAQALPTPPTPSFYTFKENRARVALKPGFCQHRPTVVAFSPHRYCVIAYIMSQPPAHYVVLVLLVQLVLSSVSASLPLSSRLCLGQCCYDSANQPESSHWFVIITPLEGFGGGSSGCRSAAGSTRRMEGKAGNGSVCVFFTDSLTREQKACFTHLNPHLNSS